MPPLRIAAPAGPGPRPTPAAWRQSAARTHRGVPPPSAPLLERATSAIAAAPPPLTAAAAAVGAWCAMSLLNRLTGKG